MQKLRIDHTQKLDKALVSFFVLCACSIVVVYIIDPSLYAKALLLPAAEIAFFSPITLVLFAILGVIAGTIYGVLHHWRWIFWPLLLAFNFSVLELPATLLQFAGIIPNFGTYPLWYSLYRLGVSFLEVGLGLWMLRIYLKTCVWGQGKKKRAIPPMK